MRRSLDELSPRMSEKRKATMENLIFSTATMAAEAIARSEISSVELTKALLHRVEVFNPRLNAITTLLSKEAIKVAKRVDEAVKAGEELGPLHGVLARDHKMPLKSRIIQTPEGSRRYQELRFWISIATLCGLTATVAPIGFTGGGLPVGVQILGPYLEDATLIDVAKKTASKVGGFRVHLVTTSYIFTGRRKRV